MKFLGNTDLCIAGAGRVIKKKNRQTLLLSLKENLKDSRPENLKWFQRASSVCLRKCLWLSENFSEQAFFKTLNKEKSLDKNKSKYVCLNEKNLINLERKRSLSFALQYAHGVHYTERGLDF